jgi:RNA polymerase sigma-70 factor (ECF subfamily)
MIPQTLNDHELIARYMQGEEGCLALLVSRHKRRVFSSIMMLVRNKAIAEDLFQETFIKVINTLRSGNYKEEGKFLPWVIRIAHNLTIDHFRRERKMPKLRDTEEYSIFDTIVSGNDNAQEVILKKQTHYKLREMIKELPFEQKEVLMMRHFADMSFKEIADTTNVSINTALGRMRYALINIRKMMKEKNINLYI